ncbi:PREDICTED: 8-oxo-dGDP phosphatase NUDT18 [Nicrophorus vespilloides]|uniref:8-oxo-dGDP phosphatase NUDT18 n=1 Tax=Nicrophorus vespilloides TaxID=110193 RepID=A0ABM1NJF6_NICVS|nr:PREDICTED: 8-oxo-dGDP phosphatase NUDT18 [Nicrophorus vespilloides]
MADSVEHYIQSVLDGSPHSSDLSELCDFTLTEHNAALETQGISPRADPTKKLVMGDNITYIVAGIIINDEGEVLMIQEAKESCAGKWYLPAGRMEKGETICAATEREVLEETGYQIKCKSLIMIECAKGTWFRFVSVGVVVGGSLKTPAQADSESIQAKWTLDLAELTLRSNDIVPLIMRAKGMAQARRSSDQTWHSDILPMNTAYPKLLLRLLVVIRKKSNNKVFVLLSEKTALHLPTCEIHPSKSVYSTLKRFMVEIFGADVSVHRPHGILSMEMDATNEPHGACLTMLVVFKGSLEEVPIIGKYVWHEVSKTLSNALAMRVAGKNSTIHLNVIN